MKIAICEDEQNWIDSLKQLLFEYFNQRHIDYYLSVFSNGAELMENPKSYDIIFMDYQMDGLNGIEVSRQIRKVNNNSTIVFISSFPNVAIDAFEVDAFRFLVKPIDKEKLFQTLDLIRKRMESDDYLVIKSRTETTSIRMSEIILCESDGRHSLIYTTHGITNISKNIKEIEHQLPNENFFRCHKAYIVSFAHIRTFSNTEVMLDNGKSAFISRNYLTKFRNAFNEYVLKYNMERI
ncbi:MAG: response regulator transcription factor [Ruminococcaceae bacterium]|nr:response regulator transcription factor [Oscillospiraceae bacterium]